MFHRIVKLPQSRSYFLFGARGTGKSTLLRQIYASEEVAVIDLLQPEVEARYQRRPDLLLGFVADNPGKRIVVDEIQKIPKLLDIVHSLLSTKSATFVLTGSSSRKLKRGGANLLAGRASVRELFPMTAIEIGESFHLESALQWGTLPEIFSIDSEAEKRDFLMAYSLTYLKEEIAAEQVVRKVDAFRGFLEVAAQSNAKLLNATKIARDVGVDTKTVQTYFSILEDTHLGFMLEQFHLSARKRVMSLPKFYFFDGGVSRALAQTIHAAVVPGTSYYGECFEQFIVCEIHRLCSYLNCGIRLFTLNSQDGFEIDLVIQRPNFPLDVCEIKSTKKLEASHLKNLALARKDFPEDTRFFAVSDDQICRIEDGIFCYHWKRFLNELFFSQHA
jgi:predicted AAA+ superfamily ATPase